MEGWTIYTNIGGRYIPIPPIGPYVQCLIFAVTTEAYDNESISRQDIYEMLKQETNLS
jgi:hypothetical protein